MLFDQVLPMKLGARKKLLAGRYCLLGSCVMLFDLAMAMEACVRGMVSVRNVHGMVSVMLMENCVRGMVSVRIVHGMVSVME